MLGGLLSEGLGYPVGPSHKLIQPAYDNEKGFYELLPFVLQNDDIMRAQVRDYGNVENYDMSQSMLDALSAGTRLNPDGSDWMRSKATAKHPHPIDFKKGEDGLSILSKHDVWMQKDPRMCVTLPSYFPFFKKPPAVVFTYRDPLEVAMSMNKRDPKIFSIQRVLRLWLLYNKYALTSSEGLCTVYTSSRRVMEDPFAEVERVGKELGEACKAVPIKVLDRAVVDDFVDPNLVHNKHKKTTNEEAKVEGMRNCQWPKWESTVEGEKGRMSEEKLYAKAMQVYCDLESGLVFEDVRGYDWPA